MVPPQPLQEAASLQAKTERWINTPRFLVIVAIFLIIGGLLSWWILAHRQETQWLVPEAGDCKKILWSRSDLPIPVWLDSADHDKQAIVMEAMRIADPTAKLFSWGGIVPLEDATKAYDLPHRIVVSTINSDKHGDTRPRYEPPPACRIGLAHVKIPGLVQGSTLQAQAAAHELLHGIGLGHSDWETDIMYPTLTGLFAPKLSDADKKLQFEAYLSP